jgi:glycosyltransferase involved in cell wall biosynthesis
MPNISLIVTVYGVEKYIERCCVSIFEQSYRDFDLTFVNDCSTDGSEAILRNVIEKYRRLGVATQLIKHEVNQGISGARETGLNAVTGEYVLYIDADDYLAPDMLEMLADRAEKTGADIVYCDYNAVKNGQALYVDQSLPESAPRRVAALMLRQKIVWAPWNKMFRRSIAVQHDVHWPPGINIGEDLVVMTKLLCYANKVEHVAKALYYYNRDNVNSYLSIWNAKSCYQNTKAVEALDHFLTHELRDAGLDQALVQAKLMARFQMLYAFEDDLRRMAIATFPETNAEVLGYARAPLYWRLALYLAIHNHRVLSALVLQVIRRMKMARQKRK